LPWLLDLQTGLTKSSRRFVSAMAIGDVVGRWGILRRSGHCSLLELAKDEMYTGKSQSSRTSSRHLPPHRKLILNPCLPPARFHERHPHRLVHHPLIPQEVVGRRSILATSIATLAFMALARKCSSDGDPVVGLSQPCARWPCARRETLVDDHDISLDSVSPAAAVSAFLCSLRCSSAMRGCMLGAGGGRHLTRTAPLVRWVPLPRMRDSVTMPCLCHGASGKGCFESGSTAHYGSCLPAGMRSSGIIIRGKGFELHEPLEQRRSAANRTRTRSVGKARTRQSRGNQSSSRPVLRLHFSSSCNAQQQDRRVSRFNPWRQGSLGEQGAPLKGGNAGGGQVTAGQGGGPEAPSICSIP